MATPHPGKWIILLDDDPEEAKPVDSQVTAIHAHLVPILTSTTEHPKAKVLYWHGRYQSNYVFDYENETPPIIVTCLFDPETNEITQYAVFRWSNDAVDPSQIFCSGHTHLANGMLITAGGERNQPPWNSGGIKFSFLFDSSVLTEPEPTPRPKPWKKPAGVQPSMTNGRWYPQLTRLNDGKVIAVSGDNYDRTGIVETPEIYDPALETWSLISGPGADLKVPFYNGAYLIPFGDWQGQVIYDLVTWGPVIEEWKGAHRFNPFAADNEYWHVVGQQDYEKMRYRGNSILLPIKSTDTNIRIINLGGKGFEGQDYTKSAEVIEIGDSSAPEWIPIGGDLNSSRFDCPNALLLADGSLVAIGGGEGELYTTLETEMLDYSDPDPANWTWSVLAFDEGDSMHVPRKYHSTGFLIPDGRVWVGGSRIYTDPQRFEFENDMERRIEFFSPGYLFEGARSEITSAPLAINYDDDFEILFDASLDPPPIINSVVLISLASVTHCYDSNQRYIILDFEETATTGTLSVTGPLDEYIAPPGYYMLFLLQDKSQSNSGEVRIPSVAKIIKLEPAL